MKKLISLSCILFLFLSNIYSQNIKPLFHLDASKFVTSSSGLVTEWKDSTTKIKANQTVSANQPNFVQSSINGKPAIRFNGNNSFMNLPSVFPIQKDYTIVVVCQAFSNTNNILGGNSRTLWMGGATAPRILHNGDFTNQVVSSIDPGIEPCLIVAQYRNAAQSGKFYINGSVSDSAYCPPNIDSTIYISAYQGGYVFNGDIAEIYLFDSYLSQTERVKLENELMSKYNLKRPSLPDSTFTEIPSNYQFYPRDVQGFSELKVIGNLYQTGFDSIKLSLFRSDTLIQVQSKPLSYKNNNPASFTFTATIKAELANYNIEVSVKNKIKDSLLAKRINLVSGDVFIITGQSNSIFGGNPYSNPFCRTFGKNYSLNKNDTLWSVASAVGYGGNNDICAWGMELSRKFIETYKIPICILNGGVGGTSIQQHQRNDIQPAVPTNIYGSLLYRAQKSKLAQAVKGIMWYQGESNASNLYFDNFKSLYEDWKLDYPNVEKVYVIQIHHGCGSGDHIAVREVLRKLPETFRNIEVFSTNGLPQHDGCHYALNGYLKLAENLFPVFQKDYYKGTDQPNIHAPNVKQAYYTKKDFSEIAVIFDPRGTQLVLPKDSTIGSTNISLKDYFSLDDNWKSLKSISINKDTLFLRPNQFTRFNYLTYLPEVNYLDTNLVYEGPYLTNQNGIGALSFGKVPIGTEIPTSIHTETSAAADLEINLLPNPVRLNEEICIDFNNLHRIKELEVNIYNSIGSILVANKKIHVSEGQQKISLPISNDKLGLYYCQFRNVGQSMIRKYLVIE